MKKADLFNSVLAYLEQEMPQTDSELVFNNPYELLVCVVLSAQCTDKRVNLITPSLFQKYPTPFDLAAASYEDVYTYIKSVSYPNSKSRYLVDSARILVEKHNGNVPDNLEELTSLPGVGRKTANVVQAIAFKKATLAVDTHVFRVSHRLGLVPDKCTTPFRVEKELMRFIPTEKVSKAHFWLLYLGRYTCTSRKPKCEKCGLQAICRHYLKNKLV